MCRWRMHWTPRNMSPWLTRCIMGIMTSMPRLDGFEDLSSPALGHRRSWHGQNRRQSENRYGGVGCVPLKSSLESKYFQVSQIPNTSSCGARALPLNLMLISSSRIECTKSQVELWWHAPGLLAPSDGLESVWPGDLPVQPPGDGAWAPFGSAVLFSHWALDQKIRYCVTF